MISKTINNFIDMLVELSKIKTNDFSGAGFVLYNDLHILSQYHCDLVETNKKLPFLQLGTDDIVSYLVKISSYQHPCHDGFHFINGDGVLTHVAQFFSPPIDKEIKNIYGQGARTFCSYSGSNINGVLLIGSVSSKGNIYLFEKGNLVNEKIMLANAIT